MIPGLQDIFNCNPLNPQPGCSSPIPRVPGVQPLSDLGGVLSGLLNIIFYIAVFLTFFYLVWGAFNYIMAQGKKEDLAKARDRITWALVGPMIILLSYFIARFVGDVLWPNISGGLPI